MSYIDFTWNTVYTMNFSWEVSNVFPDGNMSNRNSTEDGEKTSLSKSAIIFLYIFIPLITLVTVLGNIIVILAFIVDKRLRNQSNFFLLNLAICDFFIGKFLFFHLSFYPEIQRWIGGAIRLLNLDRITCIKLNTSSNYFTNTLK